MNTLDANILVRWLADDDSDPEQRRLIAETLERGRAEFHVNLVVLTETVWTLGYSYKIGRAGIARAVRAVLDHPRLRAERRATVERALAAYETGGTGFVDHLIGVLNEEAGCATTLTFDKRAAKGPLFTLIS